MSLFISIEGGEGSGKSTQIISLSKWLKNIFPKKEIVITREPGGTPQSEQIRKIIVNGSSNKFNEKTEALLMIAARAENVLNIINPALKRNSIVISDRFSDSTYVYQGIAYNINLFEIEKIHKFAFNNILPDITILLDVDPKIGLKRAENRSNFNENRFENKGIKFHQKVREGFLKIAKMNSDRFIVVNANNSFEEIDRFVKSSLIKKLKI